MPQKTHCQIEAFRAYLHTDAGMIGLSVGHHVDAEIIQGTTPTKVLVTTQYEGKTITGYMLESDLQPAWEPRSDEIIK